MATRHYLYLIRAGGAVKVGFAKSPESRLKALQTANHETLELVRKVPAARWKRCQYPACIVCAKNRERQIHKQIRGWRIRGEWFDAGCVDRVLQWMDEMEAPS